MTQIKKNLISRIQNSDDLDFLQALQTIIEASEKSEFQLSIQQEHSIAAGREEIRNGNSVENEQLMSEVKEWLGKR